MNKIKRKIQKKLQDKSLKELLLGSGVSFLVKLSGVLFAFLFNWIITKQYGAFELGIITSAISILSLGALLTKFGIDTSFLRFVSVFKLSNPKNILSIERKSYFIIVALSILITLLCYFNAEFIAVNIFNKPSLLESIKIISFGFLPFSLFSFHSEGLRALKDVKAYSFIQMTGRFMFGFLIISIFNFLFKVKINPVFAFVISLYITLLYSFIVWEFKKRKLLLNTIDEIDKKETSFSKIFNLSFPLLLVSSSVYLLNWTDILILTYFGSEEDVAIYNIALKFAMLSKIMLTSVNAIAAPNFAESHHKNDNELLKKFAQDSTKIIFWFSLPILLITILLPKTLLSIYGQEFEDAYIVLILFTLAQFISAISGSVGYLLIMTGYQKVSQNIMLFSTFLSILLNFILIPLYGINGAAVSGFISIIFRNLYSVWYIKKKFGFLTIYFPLLRKTSLKQSKNE
jgi:O-antigen/teichoic acid export membrane protein